MNSSVTQIIRPEPPNRLLFGDGPRQCIGLQFAMMEMQLALAMIVARYRVRLKAGHQIEAIPRFTLQPKGGLPVRLEKT
jgi:cytochrome P450